MMKGFPNVYCFVTNLAFSEEPTVKNRLMPYITKAIEQGFKVILVTADSTPLDEFDSNFFSHILQPSQSNRPRSFFKRVIFEWFETRKILKSLIDLDVDIVVLTIPSMFLLFNASILKRKKLYLDVRDLTWEYLQNSKPKQLVAKLLFRMIANTSFKFFSSIVVTNEAEVEYFKRKKINALLYFNGISSEQFRDLSTIPKKQHKEFTVSYVGKVGVAQNLETLVSAAEVIKDVKFNIVGYGSEYNRLQDLVLSKKLNNVTFYGNVKWKEVLRFYQESDVLYAQLQENFSVAMPSKLYQYLNASRFVIYGGGSQAQKTLSNFENNIVIPPDNVRKLVDAIKQSRKVCSQELNFEDNLKIIKHNYIRENNVSKVLQEWSKI